MQMRFADHGRQPKRFQDYHFEQQNESKQSYFPSEMNSKFESK